jgi:hypothetical protein
MQATSRWCLSHSPSCSNPSYLSLMLWLQLSLFLIKMIVYFRRKLLLCWKVWIIMPKPQCHEWIRVIRIIIVVSCKLPVSGNKLNTRFACIISLTPSNSSARVKQIELGNLKKIVNFRMGTLALRRSKAQVKLHPWLAKLSFILDL